MWWSAGTSPALPDLSAMCVAMSELKGNVRGEGRVRGEANRGVLR